MKRVGFLVNPIAGMGGRVGLKGTDGVLVEALALGAEPVASRRATEALASFANTAAFRDVEWLTCGSPMGEGELTGLFGDSLRRETVHLPSKSTTAEDTRKAARALEERGIDILLFCGGDGTARDLLDVLDERVPLLGIPAGVKMHSAVFAVNPGSAGLILSRFLLGELPLGQAEVLDLDEERYRKGEWSIRLHGLARTPQEPNLVQMGKLLVTAVTDDVILSEIADYLGELMEEEPDTAFLFGPGGTTHTVGELLGLETTLLGIDAVAHGEVIGRDLNEAAILSVLRSHARAKLVLSPIGAQGFVLGRGNLQLSPAVLQRVGLPNVLIVATPAKLRNTPRLRADTGDAELDAAFVERSHRPVIIGYRTKKMHPVGGRGTDPEGEDGRQPSRDDM
ncbi:MAG: ATP-NAD kinase family protein [Candidatus Thermoplasmatota archaeon]|nr:ATP-NAD kinase family protein [Candidatus Thermoplasmatota archaeon]